MSTTDDSVVPEGRCLCVVGERIVLGAGERPPSSDDLKAMLKAILEEHEASCEGGRKVECVSFLGREVITGVKRRVQHDDGSETLYLCDDDEIRPEEPERKRRRVEMKHKLHSYLLGGSGGIVGRGDGGASRMGLPPK